MNYILLITIILATISVIIALVIMTVIIIKMRRASILKEAAHHYETIPYPAYNFYMESQSFNSFNLNLEETGRDSCHSEKLTYVGVLLRNFLIHLFTKKILQLF